MADANANWYRLVNGVMIPMVYRIIEVDKHFYVALYWENTSPTDLKPEFIRNCAGAFISQHEAERAVKSYYAGIKSLE